MSLGEKANPNTAAIPRYWVPEEKVKKRLDLSDKTTLLFSEQSRAEQSRAEQSRAEQSRAEQSRAEQSRAEQSRAEQSRAEQSRAEQSRAEQSRAEQSRAEQSRAEQSRAEQSRAEQSRAEQSRAEQAEQSRAEQSRAEQYSVRSSDWLTTRFPENHSRYRRKNRDLLNDPNLGFERFRYDNRRWIVIFRDISRSTDQRTAIVTAIKGMAVSNKAPLLNVDYASWLQAFRGIARSTDERTLLTDNISLSGVGNSAPVISYQSAHAVASALVLANMNSIPLDWAARFSVGGVNMNFFIVKQLPVLPPDAYLQKSSVGFPYVQLIVPRVLELVFTSEDMSGFASDLGYACAPFPWDEKRRHCLRSELDAIFVHMYGLDRSDLEWILDSPAPSSSFPNTQTTRDSNCSPPDSGLMSG